MPELWWQVRIAGSKPAGPGDLPEVRKFRSRAVAFCLRGRRRIREGISGARALWGLWRPSARFLRFELAGDRPSTSRPDQGRILRKSSPGITRRRWDPFGQPSGNLVRAQVHFQLAIPGIYKNHISVFQRRDRAADDGLRPDVPDHKPARGAAESAVRDQS